MSTEAQNVDTGAEVNGTEADKINTGALGTLVAVGLFAMISITAAVTALVRHDLDAEQAEKATNENQVVTDLKAAQQSSLHTPARYVDRAKGVVSLPIETAKGLVVRELERDPASATPPASASPAPVQVTSAAVDSGAPAATLGAAAASAPPAASGQPAPPPKPGAAPPEAGRQVQTPAPGSSARPSPVPSPTPTAATPGAQAPGPTPPSATK